MLLSVIFIFTFYFSNGFASRLNFLGIRDQNFNIAIEDGTVFILCSSFCLFSLFVQLNKRICVFSDIFSAVVITFNISYFRKYNRF